MNAVSSFTPAQLRARLPELIDLLQDCVAAGASIGFVRPLSREGAQRYWEEVGRDVETGARIVLGLSADGELAGSVQLGLCGKPNGLHRAEVQKLLVHTRWRRQGFGRQLMAAVEAEGRRSGRTLLYLDTEPHQPAEATATVYDHSSAWMGIGAGAAPPSPR